MSGADERAAIRAEILRRMGGGAEAAALLDSDEHPDTVERLIRERIEQRKQATTPPGSIPALTGGEDA